MRVDMHTLPADPAGSMGAEGSDKGMWKLEVRGGSTMMQAYLVIVRPGNPDRYTDSIWVLKESAVRRAEQLCLEFERRGKIVTRGPTSEGWAAWVSPCDIQDAVLGEKCA